MPVGDLFSKFKLILWGFFLPTIGLVGLLLFSPMLLRYGGVWKKADVLILEVNETSRSKQWKLIGNLYKNRIFSKVYVLLPNLSLLDKPIIAAPSREAAVRENLLSMGILDSNIQVFSFTEGESGSSFYNAKNLIKVLVNAEVKSILVFADEYKSQRILNSYQKNILPLGIEVSVYPAKSEYDSSSWFLSEKGVSHISSELILYIFYKIRGYF
jgi:hypothetical protein